GWRPLIPASGAAAHGCCFSIDTNRKSPVPACLKVSGGRNGLRMRKPSLLHSVTILRSPGWVCGMPLLQLVQRYCGFPLLTPVTSAYCSGRCAGHHKVTHSFWFCFSSVSFSLSG